MKQEKIQSTADFPGTELESAQSLLAHIQDHLRHRKFEEVEKLNLHRELQRVEKRLLKGEYRYTDFENNDFNVPQRTREYFRYFSSYFEAARTWATVLAAVNIHKYATVADLCPGWAPKTGLALAFLGFQGRVTLIDKDCGALEQNRSFISFFHPQFSLSLRHEDLNSISQPPGELLLANHLIDDLLFDLASPETGVLPNRIYEEESAMRAVWAAILSRPKHFSDLVADRLTEIFLRLTPPGGTLVLTQYRSYIESLLDLNEAAAFCREVAAIVVERLQAAGLRHDKEIVKNTLLRSDGWFTADECFVMHYA